MAEEAKETSIEDFRTWSERSNGAFKALLAMNHVMEDLPRMLCQPKSKKQLEAFIKSLLHLLLTDTAARDTFLDYGAECEYKVHLDTYEVLEIRVPYGGRP